MRCRGYLIVNHGDPEVFDVNPGIITDDICIKFLIGSLIYGIYGFGP